MASTDPDEAKELSLVGKVELRIALADSDARLQTLLATYLCPLLLKLASPSKAVREKVVAICQHVNTRIKPNAVQLPVAALLKQFKQSPSSLVRHFDLLYFQQGLARLPVPDRLDLLPVLVAGLAHNYAQSPPNAAVLFHVLLRLLADLRLPPRGSRDDLALRAKWQLDQAPEDARFLAQWIGKLVLFTGAGSAMTTAPGLDAHEREFLTQFGKSSTWDPSAGGLRLIDAKAAAVRLLASGAFTDPERFVPALFASADGQSRVSDVGEDILKRATAAISLDDADLVDTLFSYYQGKTGDQPRPPVRGPLRIKILALLGKSKQATEKTEAIIQIVKDSLVFGNADAAAGSSVQKGLEASKLRRQVFAFINWVARIAPKSSLAAIAPSLIGDLRDYVQNQGWPKADDEVAKNPAELSARNYGYETIGLLAKACPQNILIEPELGLLHWLFRSLVGDVSSPESTISIEDALSSVLAVLSISDISSAESRLVELLSYFMTLKEGDKDEGELVARSPRYAVVRFANRCLPYDNYRARWIDIQALSSRSAERHEILEEGQKGLDPYWFRNLNPANIAGRPVEEAERDAQRRYIMPKPQELLEFFFAANERHGSELGPAFSAAAMFCRNILFHQALKDQSLAPEIDAEWQRQLDVSVTNNREARSCIAGFIERQDSIRLVLPQFVTACLHALTKEGSGDLSAIGKVVLETSLLGPSNLLEVVAGNVKELVPLVYSSKSDIRSVASYLFGVAAARVSEKSDFREKHVSDFLTKIRAWKDAIGADVHRVQGSVLALGYFFSRLAAENQSSSSLQKARTEALSLCLEILFKVSDKSLIGASLSYLDQLFIFDAFQIDALPPEFAATKLIKKLAEVAHTGNEDAVSCLGHLAMKCPQDASEGSLVMQINEVLMKLHEVRQPELHFSVGAALSCLGGGRFSDSLSTIIDLARYPDLNKGDDTLLELVIEEVLDRCKQTKPALRQASVIWLLCLVQFCGYRPAVQERLRTIQKSFVGFLSDRESLSQETASRGLALVYEKGDREVKDDLVRGLVASFTSTKSNLAGTVSEDTQLFEEGALPTGDGSITTYRDIVNLAREVGDPSLVYRFMSLASNSSIWSSRAAFGRFGLSKILSDSSVDGYMAQNPKLYPVLFRYRFDPNTNVRGAMNDIWTTLVKDPNTVIETNFDQIIEDLLKNILGKEWRTREASCAAIADLLQGRPLSIYESYLTRVWTVTFKVCDDIKGSVRKAALSLARVLTGILIRSLEAGDGSSATTDAMLKQIIPFLTGTSGFESSAEDVRAFALKTLLDIVKKGNKKALGPYLSSLVAVTLIPSLSGMEPEAVNYVHLKHDQYGLTENEIDEARLSAVKMSPMMEAIERCLDLLDKTTIEELAAQLEQTTKTVIGLPSSVGVCRVIVSLSTRHNRLFQPHAAPFLKLLRRQLLDRNDTVSTSAAAACGYICRIVESKAILSFVESAKKMYFDAEGEKQRTVSAEMVSSLVKYATDRVRDLASSILPFIYLGMHDTHDPTQELFKSAWDDLSGNSRTILLHLQDIVSLSTQNLESPKWSLKHASAFAIADIVKALGANISEAHTKSVWPAIDQALAGRTWDGKEAVLVAFVDLVSNSKTMRTEAAIAEKAKKIMTREAKRNNTGLYREKAMRGLGAFMEAFDSVDMFEQVLSIVEAVLESLEEGEDDMDIDAPKAGQPSTRTVVDQTRANAVRSLLQSLHPAAIPGPGLQERLGQCLKVVEAVQKHKDPATQNALFEGEKTLFSKLNEAKDAQISKESLRDFLRTLDTQEMGQEATRVKAAEAAEMMARVAKREGGDARFTEVVAQWLKTDRSHTVQQILQRVQRELSP